MDKPKRRCENPFLHINQKDDTFTKLEFNVIYLTNNENLKDFDVYSLTREFLFA